MSCLHCPDKGEGEEGCCSSLVFHQAKEYTGQDYRHIFNCLIQSNKVSDSFYRVLLLIFLSSVLIRFHYNGPVQLNIRSVEDGRFNHSLLMFLPPP